MTSPAASGPEVQDQLRDIRQLCGSAMAFAALKVSGAVVTWGDPEGGGDSRAVQEQLREVGDGDGCMGWWIKPESCGKTWHLPSLGWVLALKMLWGWFISLAVPH